jgi:hypothetical protein
VSSENKGGKIIVSIVGYQPGTVALGFRSVEQNKEAISGKIRGK